MTHTDTHITRPDEDGQLYTRARVPVSTQWCTFFGKNLKFVRESRADGGGKDAR